MLKVLFVLVLITYCQYTLAQTVIGNACSKTSDCASTGAGRGYVICRDGACTCSDNAVPTFDSNQCITKVEHNGVCQESIQCSYSKVAECNNNHRCECKEGYKYNGNTCVGEKGLNSPCRSNEECIVEGDNLQRTVWCDNTRVCNCRSGYKRENERCVIGGDCKTDADCKTEANGGLENSWCDIRPRNDQRFSCRCNSSFTPSANNTKCLPIVHELGSGCEDSAQCSAKLGDAYCSSQNQCRCVEGVQIKNNICGGAAISMVFSISCLALVGLVKLF
ncbi:hypothetical protein C0J52_21566 [Blattella germanica]|nr:hypothetical protein C0J52_21566 [Blattella germanica]